MSQLSSELVGDAADWFELLLITRKRRRLGIAKIRDAVAAAAPHLSDAERDDFADDIRAEIHRRAQISGPLYPFERTATGLARRAVSDKTLLLYSFLVLCSVRPSFRMARVGWKPGSIFEELTKLALAEYVGGRAEIFSDLPVAPETGIRAAIERLGELLTVRSFPEHARKVRKDHGLDVAAWRDLGDGRAGYPVVLCQCALGTKLVSKARELSPSEWDGLLHLRQNTIAAGISVPHVLTPDYEHWDELRRNTDLIVERTRLLRLLENESSPWAPLSGHGQILANELTDWDNTRQPQ